METTDECLWKTFYWEMKDRYGRLQYLMWMLRSIPGAFGSKVRVRALRPYLKACGPKVWIHGGVKIRNLHRLSIGNNVHVGEDVFIQAGGDVDLCDNVMLGPGVKIWSQNHTFRETGPVNDSEYEFAKVVVGEDAWIGANSIILPGVVLPRGAIVSAGSVVGIRQYPENCVIAGNPARVVRLRAVATATDTKIVD